MPFRFDTYTLDGQFTRSPEGFLRTVANVTRSGVFRYRNLDGSERLELRHDAEVFKDDSINTLKMVPMTNDHPSERVVTAGNSKTLQVGFTGENIRKEKPFLKLPVVVIDEEAVSDVIAGKRELSCAYHCDVVREDGEYNGEKYTHVQKNIRYNHVAIVHRGRAGSDVKIKLDSFRTDSDPDVAYRIDTSKEICNDCKKLKSDCSCNKRKHKNDTDKSLTQRGRKMSKYKIDNIEYEADQEVINRCDKLANQLVEITKTIDTLTADRDAQKARADKAETEVKALPQKIADASTARRNLETAASKVLPKDTKLDGLTEDQIRAQVIATKFPNIKLDGKSADYVTALFDSALEAPAANPAAVNNQAMSGFGGFNSGSQSGDNRQDGSNGESMVHRLIDHPYRD